MQSEAIFNYRLHVCYSDAKFYYRSIAAVPGVDALFVGCADLTME